MNKFISLITSSYNCAKYIDKTIESILGQGYPRLQYIVVDGESTDATLEIINNYRDLIDTIICEPDEGMYHGINKGFDYATGEIMSWLNCDDIYYPWTFSVVENIFRKFPEVDWIIGLPSYINQSGQCIKVSSNACTAYPRNYIRNGWFRPQLAGYLQQESMFWRKSLWEKAGGLNLTYKYAADFELWTRFAQYAELYSVSVPLAGFRIRPGEQKSSVHKDKYEEEVEEICLKFEAPLKIWDFTSKRGGIGRILSRLIIWKQCNFITYSSKNQEWVMKKGVRPLSRYSQTELFLEWYANR